MAPDVEIAPQPPPWHVLLGPLPAGATPCVSADAAPELAAVAGWENLVLELSAGSAGLRIVQVLLDAERRPLSVSDHVLFRSEPEGQSS